ncbi:MAG: S8 family serine peptidase [Bdellovibrionales bacterium]
MKTKLVVIFLALPLMACDGVGQGYGFSTDDEPVTDPLNALLEDDPLNVYAWHLQNRGQKSYSTYAATRGIDVNMLTTLAEGYDGTGVRVCVSDAGVESTHADLSANVIAGGSTDYSTMVWGTGADPLDTDDNHGTAVAGLIFAEAGNDEGSRGLAPGVTWASKNFLSEDVTQSTAVIVDQADGAFEVFNYSWGSSAMETFLEMEPLFEAQMLDGITNLRGGLGAIYVKAAGNEYQYQLSPTITRHGLANFDGYNSTPYTVVVGAINSAGVKANYSSTGPNLWVSAPSGQSSYPQMITTDRNGCTLGYANVAFTGFVPSFNLSSSTLNPNCRYDIAFNGTSAAAPVVSGAVALILDANAALTWRDVKHILAQSARQVSTGTTSFANSYVSSPSGYTWEQGWVTNGAGFHFHNHFGFGMIDVDGAVSIAKTYVSALGTFTQSAGGAGAWDYQRTGLAVAIPDNSATGGTDTMNVATSMVIEAVQIRAFVTHNDIGQLAIELTSPANTKSIIVNMNNSLDNLSNYLGEVFLTNAFYGENTSGTWRIRVFDGLSGDTGTLTRWELRFSGH